jgi:hypothetical protein
MEISVAIGRNVGNEPMPDKEWERFKMDILTMVLKADGTVVVEETGKSQYQGEEEEHYRIIANVDSARILDIRRQLGRFARERHQWGIALSFVSTTIIGPNGEQVI